MTEKEEPQKVVIQDPVPESMQTGVAKPASADVREARQPVPSPEPSLPPKTTLEEDKKTAGQRGINLIWETTQRNVAYLVIGSALFGDFLVIVFTLALAYGGLELSNVTVVMITAALMQMNTFAGLVLGFYFGRTNHARQGDTPTISGV